LLAAALERWEHRTTTETMRGLDAIADHRRRLELCYRHLGLPAATATSRAVFAYAAYRGLLQLAHEAAGSLPTEWSNLSGGGANGTSLWC
jgi:hypothetical protein